jgi:ActR/RegA family two-component response regulator
MAAPRNPRLSALWKTSPEEAIFEIQVALAMTGGDVGAAARRLTVSRKTLYRYLHDHPEILR